MVVSYIVYRDGQKKNFARFVSIIRSFVTANEDALVKKWIDLADPRSLVNISEQLKRKALKGLPEGDLKKRFEFFLFPKL